MLLPVHREENIVGNGVNLLVLVLALVMVLVVVGYCRYRWWWSWSYLACGKKNASGSEDRLILLPLITQGSFPKHPENLRRKIEWDVVDAIAKETRSLKLRYCADPRHLLFLR